MPIVSVEKAKTGFRHVLQVDFDDPKHPVFPDVCPCCMKPVDTGAYLYIERGKEDTPLRCKACSACARHVAIMNKISSATGLYALFLALASIAAYLIIQGGPLGWTWPFRSSFNGVVSLLALIVLLIAYSVVLSPVLMLVDVFFLKKDCTCRGVSPVQAKKVLIKLKPYFRYIFENQTYGQLFVKANQHEK